MSGCLSGRTRPGSGGARGRERDERRVSTHSLRSAHLQRAAALNNQILITKHRELPKPQKILKKGREYHLTKVYTQNQSRIIGKNHQNVPKAHNNMHTHNHKLHVFFSVKILKHACFCCFFFVFSVGLPRKCRFSHDRQCQGVLGFSKLQRHQKHNGRSTIEKQLQLCILGCF